MIDPVGTAIGAVSGGSIGALPAAFAAGLVTSCGPCVAPRYVALAALLDDRARARTIATFVAGMLLVYALLGFGFGVLGLVTGQASLLYVVLSAALLAGGVRTLLAADCCIADGRPARKLRTSGAFSLGAASALVVSPCCTPVVAAVAGFAGGESAAGTRVLLLAAFALGHAAPLFAAVPLGAVVDRRLPFWNRGPGSAIVSGALLIALGGYYGLLV